VGSLKKQSKHKLGGVNSKGKVEGELVHGGNRARQKKNMTPRIRWKNFTANLAQK